MNRSAAAFVVGLLLTASGQAADLLTDNDYLNLCRVVVGQLDTGQGSVRRNDDGTLTVEIWLRDEVAGEEPVELGSFCDFSATPRRFTQVYLAPCYHCGFAYEAETIKELNRQYFGG